MSDGPYSRLYHKFADEYPHVFDDFRTFGMWAHLLVLADAAWPMMPRLPAHIDRKALAILTGAELVEVDGQRYYLRGHVAERTRRRDSARIGANALHSQGKRSANALQSLSERGANGVPSKEREEKEKRVNGTVVTSGRARPRPGLVDPLETTE